jgi:hypothetical protein
MFSGDGKVDTNPGVLNSAYGLAIQSNDKLVVTGGTGDVGNREFVLLRYKPNGTLDNTFSGNG